MAWIAYKKGLQYSISELDTTRSKNVQNTRLSCTVYREDHGNQKSGIDSRRKKLSRSKDTKRHITGRCTTTIMICNIDYATQPHRWGMHSRIQTL